jgi:two-component system sensor histidine kinase KdpD
MTEHRPDPEALLERIRNEEERSRRGRLKVFFGACAGVGTTFAMLEAARRKKAEGIDVVAGWVETLGRPETAALLEGLESIPARSVEYRGTVLREFDLDAARARRPALLLLDELAHSNAPGSRHAKPPTRSSSWTCRPTSCSSVCARGGSTCRSRPSAPCAGSSARGT